MPFDSRIVIRDATLDDADALAALSGQLGYTWGLRRAIPGAEGQLSATQVAVMAWLLIPIHHIDPKLFDLSQESP